MLGSRSCVEGFRSETGAAGDVKQRKSLALRERLESHRRAWRSKSLPCSRRSKRGKQTASPSHWTRNCGSWGACGHVQIRPDQPGGRCGWGRRPWGSHHKGTGRWGTAVQARSRTPRRPGTRGQREARYEIVPADASKPPQGMWSGTQTWAIKHREICIRYVLVLSNCGFPVPVILLWGAQEWAVTQPAKERVV